jgi:hypothetical protein
VLEGRHEQIADGVYVAGWEAQRTCPTIISGDRGRASAWSFSAVIVPPWNCWNTRPLSRVPARRRPDR